MPQKLPISKYRRVKNNNDQKKADNVLLLRSRPRAFVYAAYAAKMIYNKPDKKVQLTATGTATYKVIQTVEFLRRRMKGLHIAYDITTTVFKDVYEPLENGLDTVVVDKNVASIEATLSLNKSEVEKMRGYMAPLDEKKLLDENKFKEEIEEHQKRQKEREERGEREDEETERKPRQNQNQRRGRGRNNRNRNKSDRKEEREDKEQDKREDDNGEEKKPRRGRKNNRGNRRGQRKSTYEEARDNNKGGDNNYERKRNNDNDDGEERRPRKQNRRGRGGNFRGGYRQKD